MLTLNTILHFHQNVIIYDKDLDPTDFTSAIRSLTPLELMFEYSIKGSNTVFQNAAIVVNTIVAKHPFYNGNKRTGFEAMCFVIEDGGYKFITNDDEFIDFIIKVATTEKEIPIREIENWIIDHTVRN